MALLIPAIIFLLLYEHQRSGSVNPDPEILELELRIRPDPGPKPEHWREQQFINYQRRSVADPGCLSRIRVFSIPDPGSASKNFNPKKLFLKLSEIWSRLFIPNPDPGSGFLTHPRIQGSKRLWDLPDLQHCKKTSIHHLFPSPAFQCVAACCSSRQNPLAWRGVCEGRRGWSGAGLSSATPPQVRPVSRVSAICRSASPPISFRKYGQLQGKRIKYKEGSGRALWLVRLGMLNYSDENNAEVNKIYFAGTQKKKNWYFSCLFKSDDIKLYLTIPVIVILLYSIK